MAFPTSVNDQITDAVTQTNVKVVAEEPALSEPNTLNIRFADLVKGIYAPDILDALMLNYEDVLNPYHCYQVKSIVPILRKRIKNMAAIFHKAAKSRKNAWGHAECFLQFAREHSNSLEAMYTIVHANDYGSDIYKAIEDYNNRLKNLNAQIQDLYLQAVDEAFEESSLLLDSLVKKYKKLDAMIAKEESTDAWVLKQVQEDQQKLQQYHQILALDSLKQASVKVYHEVAATFQPAFDLEHKLTKLKSINPLISDDLLKQTALSIEQLRHLSVSLNTWINALHGYNQKLLDIKERIQCFDLIAEKMVVAETA